MPTTCHAKVKVLDPHLCSLSLLDTLPKLGEMSTCPSEHKTDGVKIHNLAILQMNLSKRCVISEVNASTIDVTRSHL